MLTKITLHRRGLMSSPYFVNLLNSILSERKLRRPNYSMRAFSRDLAVSPALMSLILNGKRSINAEVAQRLCENLSLNPTQKTLFMESVAGVRSDAHMLASTESEIISEWEHFAIFELIEVSDFRYDIDYIARKLSIEPARVETCVRNLLEAGLLSVESGVLKKVFAKLRTTDDVMSKALKNAQIENLHIGLKKIEEIDVEFRDFSSVTLVMNRSKLSEVKVAIREFRKKLEALVLEDEKTDVFQVAIQFYPLSVIDSNQRSSK
jgi:hypothetical protein